MLVLNRIELMELSESAASNLSRIALEMELNMKKMRLRPMQSLRRRLADVIQMHYWTPCIQSRPCRA